MYILTGQQAEYLLDKAKQENTEVEVSLDLNRSKTSVFIHDDNIRLTDTCMLSFRLLKKMAKHPHRCYQLIADNDIQPIVLFSEKTQMVRSLFATQTAPTMLVGGYRMHRVKQMDPISDTRQKTGALGYRRKRHVLDTATGLGYSAIVLAKKSEKVTTVEIDPASIELAKINPWSQELFSNSKISLIEADIGEYIGEVADGTFSHIFHDPPSFHLAPQLYSESLYRDLFRSLELAGWLYHYIGDPDSGLGTKLFEQTEKKLKKVGFTQVVRHGESFGMIARKPSSFS